MLRRFQSIHVPLYRIIVVVLLSALLITSLVGSVGATTALPVSNVQQTSVVAWRSITLLSAFGVTQALTGTAFYLPDFALGDCYSTVSVGSQQTVTVSFKHSANAVNWASLYSYPAVSVSGTSFTHTALYGNYMLASVALGTSNPVTVTAQCVAKNQ